MTYDVAKLVKEAAKAAELAPEHLQEAAFNKAFEALMGGVTPESGRRGQTRKARATTHRERGVSGRNATGPNVLEQLDRTAHPDISHNDTSLNNALRVIRAAKAELGVDGVTASRITKVLVDKFRCKITQQAVSQALNRAGRYVNRQKEGKHVLFRIMGPGEDYLDGLKSPDSHGSKPRTRKRKRAGEKAAIKSFKKKENEMQKTTRPKRTSSKRKVGPATAISRLYDIGYFSTGHTIVEIVDRLRHDFGHTLKQNEISPVLLRWLRGEKLVRTLNSDKQYEYKQP
jgi:hypothetical protein